MVLDREGPEFLAADSLAGAIVEAQVRQLDVLAPERIEVHAKPVVLAGDLDLAGAHVVRTTGWEPLGGRKARGTPDSDPKLTSKLTPRSRTSRHLAR